MYHRKIITIFTGSLSQMCWDRSSRRRRAPAVRWTCRPTVGSATAPWRSLYDGTTWRHERQAANLDECPAFVCHRCTPCKRMTFWRHCPPSETHSIISLVITNYSLYTTSSKKHIHLAFLLKVHWQHYIHKVAKSVIVALCGGLCQI